MTTSATYAQLAQETSDPRDRAYLIERHKAWLRLEQLAAANDEAARDEFQAYRDASQDAMPWAEAL